MNQLTYEVNEEIDGFRWYVKDATGEIVDSWARDLRYDEQAERMVGARTFRTEQAALEHIAAEYPDAVDFHRYLSPERDAEIQAWADQVNAAAASAEEG